ncbi:alcohol dehydrogenase catalytic domain-containing protein [Actinomadura roseirufa]|uniref:alcohol dehydrogenase catalytic domain-containing protein n=1 Tax=Actinomadura roseirufa TaxID=2094049 RepID=UPI0010413F0C|nr:Zn-dependent alcohol dehydrogenase [Actinomadura roseirufa]
MARAAVLHTVGDTDLDLRDDVVTAAPGPGQVKVTIKATGVCHSDLSTMAGVLPAVPPAVLGHEGAGVVAEVGERVTGLRPGDHVVINWTPDCGACGACLRGEPYLCTTHLARSFREPNFALGDGTPAFGMAGTGTWAEQVVVPERGAVKVAEDVPFEYAALLGCGLPTGVGAVVNTARVRPGTSVAVIGAGGVGLAVVQGARIAGAATILAVDPNQARHAAAKTLGATHTATPAGLAEAKAVLTGGAGFDYAFEVVGRSSAITTAWDAARRGGDVVVVGAGAADDEWTRNAFSLLFDGKTLRPSPYGGSDLRRDIPRLVALWRSGKLDIDALISRRIGFEDLNDALRALRDGEVIRQVVLFE